MRCPKGGGGELKFVSPIVPDIFDVCLDGYMIRDGFIPDFFPGLSYLEVVTRLRNIYFEHNQTPGDPNLEETLISENELLVLLGEQILTKTTPLPTTTMNSKMDTKKTPGPGYHGAPESYVSESSSLEPTETHETTTSGTTESNANGMFSTTATSTELFTTKTFHPDDRRYLTVSLIKGNKGYRLNYFGPYFGEILGKPKYKCHPLRLWKAISTLFKAITRGQSSESMLEKSQGETDQACNCVCHADPLSYVHGLDFCFSTTAYVKTISGKPCPTDEYMSKIIVDNLCDYNDKLKPSIMKLCRDHWGFKLDKKKG